MEGGTSVEPVATSTKREKSPRRNYSEETFCSESSDSNKSKNTNNLLQKRRRTFTAATGEPYRNTCRYIIIEPNKTNLSPIAQTVLSTKVLRLKQVQNELNEARFKLKELTNENRILRTLQKRQDLALSRFEGKQAELPELLNAHSEEVRTLRANIKQLKSQVHQLESRLKDRDSEFLTLQESYTELSRLSKDRHLGERDALQKRVEALKQVNEEQAQTIQVLRRKVTLEGKNFRHQLNNEIANHRNTQRELALALERVAKLHAEVEAKQRVIQSNLYINSRHLHCAGTSAESAAVGSVVSLTSSSQISRFPEVRNLNPVKQDKGKVNRFVERVSQCNTKGKVSLIQQPDWQLPTEDIVDQLHIQGTRKMGVYSTSSRIRQHQFETSHQQHHTIQEDTDSDLQQATVSSGSELFEEGGNTTDDTSKRSSSPIVTKCIAEEISLDRSIDLTGNSNQQSKTPSPCSSLSRTRRVSLNDDSDRKQALLYKEIVSVEKCHPIYSMEDPNNQSCDIEAVKNEISSPVIRRRSVSSDSNSSVVRNNHTQEELAANVTKEIEKDLLDSGDQVFKSNKKEELLASLQAIDKGEEVPLPRSLDLEGSEIDMSKSRSKTDLMRELFGST